MYLANLIAAEIQEHIMKTIPNTDQKRQTLKPQIIPSTSSSNESMTAEDTTGAAKKPSRLKIS